MVHVRGAETTDGVVDVARDLHALEAVDDGGRVYLIDHRVHEIAVAACVPAFERIVETFDDQRDRGRLGHRVHEPAVSSAYTLCGSRRKQRPQDIDLGRKRLGHSLNHGIEVIGRITVDLELAFVPVAELGHHPGWTVALVLVVVFFGPQRLGLDADLATRTKEGHGH